ncbi:serine/threonine-protein phosphatase [Sphingomonas lutea]|uniref:Serine/threonine-protein phosphatase n=1 Tax=Sphingomonas lutea TaxID=1045317 RepID=A0A7G9SHE1_9SPHN|nr:protein phosphatase 2C domain-containing protein [Sphingomonas lutea]QNN67266.1 serine/threonine-protein phosphatase [Sphingomonas lutea]
MNVECVSRTHVGCKRKINEDAILVASERGLWAVADGMGGHESGEVASGMVVEALRALPDNPVPDEAAADAIDVLRRVNRELVDMARVQSREKSIGTTVVGIIVADDVFRCFWAGDSRAYLMRDGQMHRLSRDHSLVQDLVDAGMLKPEEAEGHANSNVITRAVGVSETLEVDVVGGVAQSGDLFLLASDGLTRVMTDQEIAAELRHGANNQAIDALLDCVIERGAPDNVSMIIVKLG